MGQLNMCVETIHYFEGINVTVLELYSKQKIVPLLVKTHPYTRSSILQVPTTQLDLKFVELTADVLEIFFTKLTCGKRESVSYSKTR